MKNYQEFLNSQKPSVLEKLETVIETEKVDLDLSSDAPLGVLRDALGLALSADPDTRRDQLIAMGFDPKKIRYMDFTGSSAAVSVKVTDHFIGQIQLDQGKGSLAVKEFASKLKVSFENL